MAVLETIEERADKWYCTGDVNVVTYYGCAMRWLGAFLAREDGRDSEDDE
jgi:hypothetical protein